MKEIILIKSKFDISSNPTYLIVGLELIIGVLMGFGAIALGLGGGSWILGGIAAGALVFYFYRSLYNNQAQPHRNSRKVGQILVGLTIGFSIQNNDLSALSPQIPIFILLTSFLMLSGGIIGYIYSRLEKTDLLTAVLATVPGNIGVMASMAADYERDTTLVSLVQLIRFTAIILVVPLIANVSNPHDINVILSSLTKDFLELDLKSIFLICLLLITTFGVIKVTNKLKVPVASLFCSIIVGLFFNSLLGLLPFVPQIDLHLPPLFNLVGQTLLGMTIGEYWGMEPKLGKRTVVYAVVPVLLTFFAGLFSAGIATFVTHWDWLTCLLVASPGGSPEMILIALSLNHHIEIVTAGHLFRLLAINLSLPILVSFVCYLENRFTLSKDSVAAIACDITPEN